MKEFGQDCNVICDARNAPCFAELGCYFKPVHIEAEKVDVFIIFCSGYVL